MWCCWIRLGGWWDEWVLVSGDGTGLNRGYWEVGGYDIHESVVMGLALFTVWWCLIFEIVLSMFYFG